MGKYVSGWISGVQVIAQTVPQPPIGAKDAKDHVDLYRGYGLYKPPTAAGWRSAHGLVRRTSESRVWENGMRGLMREGRCEPVLYSTRDP